MVFGVVFTGVPGSILRSRVAFLPSFTFLNYILDVFDGDMVGPIEIRLLMGPTSRLKRLPGVIISVDDAIYILTDEFTQFRPHHRQRVAAFSTKLGFFI